MIELSAEARAVIAGLVAPTDEVNSDGIFADDEVWAEIRRAFPPYLFWEWAGQSGDNYDENAGL